MSRRFLNNMPTSYVSIDFLVGHSCTSQCRARRFIDFQIYTFRLTYLSLNVFPSYFVPNHPRVINVCHYVCDVEARKKVRELEDQQEAELKRSQKQHAQELDRLRSELESKKEQLRQRHEEQVDCSWCEHHANMRIL